MSLNGSLVGVTSHITPLPAGEGLGEGPVSYGLEIVRQIAPWTLCALWEKKLPSESICLFILFRGYFSFSQIYTEEQNTQHSTETLSQPISQNNTANVSWKASVNSVCRRPSVSSKRAPKCSVNSVRSVREKPIHDSQVFSFSHRKTRKNRTHRVKNKWYPPLRRLYIIRC